MKESTPSLRRSILLCLVALALALSAVTAAGMWSRSPQTPELNGVLIPNGKPLQSFELVDHRNQPFTRADLQGEWHIVSYGYTHCPDVCPTTLMTLAGVARLLEEDPDYSDVRFLFYTVDPARDTVDRLAEYVPWFHPDFVGLTQPEGKEPSAAAFEQSLGMASIIEPLAGEPIDGSGGYSVSHGAMLYLLNPAGKLQAVFKPSRDELGTLHFSVDRIYRDYRAVRAYLADSG